MRKLEDLNKSYFGPRVSDGAGTFIAGFVFLYIFQIILLIIAYLSGVDIEHLENTPVWFTWVTMIVNQLALICAVFAYSAMSGKPLFKECKIEKKLSTKQILIIPVIALVSIMAFLPLAEGFTKLVELITKKSPSVDIGIGGTWWEIMLSVVFVSVLPAIGEELLFRGCVARGLKRKNYLFAIIMSGFMFSIFHGNAAQTVHQFLIGMVFAYVYFASGSLLASMICHFANNALAILLDVILGHINIELPVGGIIAIYVVMCIVGFVALYFLLRYFMKISKQAKGIPCDTDKNAWANDIAKAFTITGIKDNYHRLNNSLKTLFDDACDGINVNGDIVKDEFVDSKTGRLIEGKEFYERKKGNEQEIENLLAEANKQTIQKRKRFDLYSLIAAVGIALAVWIINLIVS